MAPTKQTKAAKPAKAGKPAKSTAAPAKKTAKKPAAAAGKKPRKVAKKNPIRPAKRTVKKTAKPAAKRTQPEAGMIAIQQVRSQIGTNQRHREVLRGLGLRGISHTVERQDSPAVRGMVAKIPHLVRVQEAR